MAIVDKSIIADQGGDILQITAAGEANVIGPLTDAELRAVPVPVSGTVTTTPSVTGGGTEVGAQRVTIASDSTGVLSVDDNGLSLTVDDGGLSLTVDGPLTDAELRASAVPVSGTVTITPSGTQDVNIVSSITLTVDTELPAAFALADDTSNPVTTSVGNFNHVYDGATWDRQPGNSADGALVNLGVNNDVTVTSGSITETNSAAILADTTAIKTAVEILDNAIAGSEMQVDIVSSALPTGAATEATLAAILADTANIETAVQLIDNAISGSEMQVDVVAALPAGTNLLGKVNIDPATSGGLTTFHLVSAGTTNATNIKASAGQVFGWYIYNSNAAARKVVFHNTAGTPTAGASVFFSLMIPPTSGANVFSDIGITFGTGVAITTVTGLADSDSAAVAANDLIINIFYK